MGIGITSAKDESGYLKVKKVLKNSPAAESGIEVGDHIISLADTDLKTVSNENAQRLMKGEVGTKIKLVYRRNGLDTPLDIIRTDITIPTVEFKMIDTNAMIKISSFDDLTHVQFADTLDKAIKQKATGIIFDLRNCTGDSISSVKSMLNTILPSGDIGTLISNTGKQSTIGTSDKFEINLPMATIINSKTAGTAELFAAALRDYNKANSVGTLTFGKGVLQTLIPLTDGSAINLTTSKFLPPSGEEINGIGIKPDYEVKLTTELEQRFDELLDTEDPQLQKAIEVVHLRYFDYKFNFSAYILNRYFNSAYSIYFLCTSIHKF